MEMSGASAFITLATGVLMPTFDVYSDIFFAIRLLMFEPPDYCDGQHEANQKYAAAMLSPPLISWLFVAYQWFRIEAGTKRKGRYT